MPTVLASTIIGKAQILAQDTGAVRWSLAEWLGWLNDGQREIVTLKPSAYSKIANVTLAAGTKQAIPSDGVEFLEFIRNMGASGTTPGRAARRVSRSRLDASIPDWHSTTATAVVQHFIFDPLAPKAFYVYPPSTGGVAAEVLYSAVPADLTLTSQTIVLEDIYQNALLDYMLYRAYSKDSEFVGNAERALLARKQFEAALGMKAQGEASALAVVGA